MPCCKKRAARKSAECFNHVFDYVSSAGSWRMPALHRCLSVLVLIYPCMHVLPCTQVVHHTHCPAALYLRVSCSTRPPAAAVVQPRPSLLPRRPPRRPRSPSQSQRTRTRPQVVTTVTRTRRMSKRLFVSSGWSAAAACLCCAAAAAPSGLPLLAIVNVAVAAAAAVFVVVITHCGTAV